MLKNMKIGAKLFLLLGFLSLLLIAIGMLGLRGIKTTDDSLETIYNDRLVPATLLAKTDSLRRENIQELLLALQHDPRIPASKIHEADHPVTQHTDAVAANRPKIDKLWEQYMATTLTAEEKKLTESFNVARKKLRDEGQEPMMAFLKDRKFDEAGLHGVNKLIPIFKQAEQDFEALMQLQIDVAKDEHDKADANYERTRNLAIASIIAGILLALGIGYWTIRSVTGSVIESLEALSATSAEIAATVEQHERTAAQQAVAVTETATAMDELGASASQVSMQAESAASQTEEVLKLAEQGTVQIDRAGDAVAALKGRTGQMTDQILRWSEQNTQISAIASLVGDIASNTNMLAINAAVEAARAGEHGKGFAVISSEIRKLADESKKSAERIGTLISGIQKTANATVMSAEEGNKIIEEVAGLAKQNSDLMIGIATSAEIARQSSRQIMLNVKQQASAISQVVGAVKSIGAGAKETYAGIRQVKIATQTISESLDSIRQVIQ